MIARRKFPLRSRLALLLSLSLGLAACAQGAMNPAAPTATPSQATATPMEVTSAPSKAADRESPGDLAGQLAALNKAEADLNLAFAGRSAKAARPAGDAAGTPQRSPATAPSPAPGAASLKGGEEMAPADPCATACVALASMERATTHLCGLAGDGDPRCEDARTRVRSATDRVRASCPACAAN